MMTAALIAAVSLIYATAGQAGGTAFLAIMALMDFPSDEMRPTALFLNIVAGGYSTWQLHRNRAIDWPLLGSVALPSLPAAFVGGLIELPSKIYFILTGCILLGIAGLMLFRPVGRSKQGPVDLFLPGLLGAGIGFTSGLIGVGGGVFLTPAIVTLGWLPPKRAAAVAAPYILSNSVISLAAVFLVGQRLADQAGYYAVAAIVGAAFGTWIGLQFMSDRATRYVFAGIILFAGLRLIWK